jgi:hypothetical protein
MEGWIRLAQDRSRWRAVVSAVTNLRFLATRSKLVIGTLAHDVRTSVLFKELSLY